MWQSGQNCFRQLDLLILSPEVPVICMWAWMRLWVVGFCIIIILFTFLCNIFWRQTEIWTNREFSVEWKTAIILMSSVSKQEEKLFFKISHDQYSDTLTKPQFHSWKAAAIFRLLSNMKYVLFIRISSIKQVGFFLLTHIQKSLSCFCLNIMFK